ncbi:MAG TPA: DUF3014 domain-containing protein [Alphaproteobacteria bacterium]|nr:DUF3014 domain-containing protein [Alphaproteobacteria bacterium]
MADQSEQPTTLNEILRRRRRRTIRAVAVVVVLLVLAGAGWWLFFRGEEPPRPMPSPPTPVERPEPEPAPVPAPAPEPRPEPAEPVAESDRLPPVDSSDSLVREEVGALSEEPELTDWLTTDEIVRRFVASVDNVAEGRTPRDQLVSMWPTTRFTVVGDPERPRISPLAYARYDRITDVFVSIDSRSAVRVYRELRPLIDEAYRDLGYPDRPFDEALEDAIAELLAAPVVVGDPYLEPRVISYAYEDPALEGLSDAQKQLLRMGPENAPRIQRKLREVARTLGIPESELPLTPIYQVPSDDEASPGSGAATPPATE